jgi:hypothetical protein
MRYLFVDLTAAEERKKVAGVLDEDGVEGSQGLVEVAEDVLERALCAEDVVDDRPVLVSFVAKIDTVLVGLQALLEAVTLVEFRSLSFPKKVHLPAFG